MYRPLEGRDLGDRIAEIVGHPDVGSIECHTIGASPHSKCSHSGASAGQQLANTVVAVVGHPDVGSIKCHRSGECPDGVGQAAPPL